MRTIIVISAGLSLPSRTTRVGSAIGNAVKAELQANDDDAAIYTVELKDLAHDLADAMTGNGSLTPALKQTVDTVAGADAIIAVTPVFQSSYSGLFKMFFDVFSPTALVNTPVIIAATAGSQRHALVLEYAVRPLFAYLRSAIVPTGIFISKDDDLDNLSEALSDRLKRAARELGSLLVG